MKTMKRSYTWLVVLLLIALAFSSTAAAAAPLASANNAPARGVNPAPMMDVLPADTCTLAGNVRTCHLYAKTGSITVPGANGVAVDVPIWGFADSAASAATLPGPTIIANAGEQLDVVLHNELAGETVALDFPGHVGLRPDLDGVATGATKTYSFTLANPGTFLYKAGPTPNGSRQVLMGLLGALVVRPAAAGTAYGPGTEYQAEALVMLSEVDPAFNADPNGFSIDQYNPKFWLINGKAFPNTAVIGADAGQTVLLRYINAGGQTQSIGVLGSTQKIVGRDGEAYDHPTRMVAESLSPVQTMDTLVTVPASATVGSKLTLYRSNMIMHNNNLPVSATDTRTGFGGMITFISVVNGAATTGNGPLVTGANVTPNNTQTGTVQLSATATASAGNVSAMEYYVNNFNSTLGGTAFTGLTAAATASASANIDVSTWAHGVYTFYVRAQDASGVWGPVSSTVLNLDKVGPASTEMVLTPSATNGSVNVKLRMTANDHETGRNNVTSAEYSLDGTTYLPMTRTAPATAAAMVNYEVTIPAATINTLPEGLQNILVRSTDSLGNVGAATPVVLTVDKTGPQVSNVAIPVTTIDLAAPPTGTMLKLTATIDEPLSGNVRTTLVGAEGYIDADVPFGKGFQLFASDGQYDEVSETVYINMPLNHFLYLPNGTHTIHVRGRDAAGNWTTLTGQVTVTIVNAPQRNNKVYIPVAIR